MKKVIAISFTDVHFHEWPNYKQNTDRLELYRTLFNRLALLGEKYKTNVYLFSGDLVHNNANISNRTYDVMTDILYDFLKHNHIYAISGNHDQSQLSTYENYGPNWIHSLQKSFNNLHNVDHSSLEIYFSVKVRGIPYLNDPKSFKKALVMNTNKDKSDTILLMHQTLPGSVESTGYKLESSFKRSIFDKLGEYGLVLNGHIHKFQRHTPTIVTVGSTHQQTLTDYGARMGCLLIHDDLTYTRVRLGMPEFRYEKTNGWDYEVEKVEEPKEEEEPEVKEFHIGNSPITLAENYLKKRKIKSKAKRKILIRYLR